MMKNLREPIIAFRFFSHNKTLEKLWMEVQIMPPADASQDNSPS